MENGFRIPFGTIVKVLATLLFVRCLGILAPLLMTIFLAALAAVSLDPVIEWLSKKGVSRAWGISLITFLFGGSVIAAAVVMVPKIFAQAANFIESLPHLKEQLLGTMSERNPLRPFIEHTLKQQPLIGGAELTPWFSAGSVALGGITEFALIFVFTVFLMISGKTVIEWFSGFFSEENQFKIRRTCDEVSPIISSYVAGQLITSMLAFVFVFTLLTLLHVPSVLLLATLAGVFDILPVLGFFLAVIPAMLFALTVSPVTALLVLVLYVFYHAIENYLIVPKIYGKRLRVSSFVVFASLLIANLLAGVEGAIAVLPVVASYPIIERIWLKRFVGSDTIEAHAGQYVEKPDKPVL